MLCGDLEDWDGGGREAQEEGHIPVLIAELLCYIAETNTTL